MTAFGCCAYAAEEAEKGDAAETTEEDKGNPELDAETAYIEALIENGYPDLANPLIAAVKKKWPESEVKLFAIEVKSLVTLGDFDGADKKIASLPDRDGPKYWAARIEMANGYYGRNRKAECMKIYEEFFKKYPEPPKLLKKFHMDASYMYGALLKASGDIERAADIFTVLMKRVDEETWLDLAGQVGELRISLALDYKKAGKKKEMEEQIKKANKIAERLLWRLDQPVFFGKGISMKAHCEQIKGNAETAAAFIEEYEGQLEEMHDAILEADPDGSAGVLRLSPLPECLYLQASMKWDEAQEEAKKPKPNHDHIKDLIFGKKEGGKRDNTGAFKIATKIFLNYQQSPWAADAGDMAEAMREFAEKKYDATIKTKITKEQIRKLRAKMFADADEKFANGDLDGAVKGYFLALEKNPELLDSVRAIMNIVNSYLDMLLMEGVERSKEDIRLDADAIEGYLSERFAGSADKVLMTEAGNALCALAAKEKERKEGERADKLYTAFIENYTRHINAPLIAYGKGGEARKAENWGEAIKYYSMLERLYTNNVNYVATLSSLSYCYGKLGDSTNEIRYIEKYLPLETIQVRRLQAKMQLAQMYQKDGLAVLATLNELGTNAPPERVEKDEKRGSAQIIRALKQFTGFSEEAAKAIADPGTLKGDVEKYQFLREAALYLVGDCWGRLSRPADKLQMFRERAAESYEAYLKDYPDAKYSKAAYVRLGTIYTALGQPEKSKDALDRLSKNFPDSDEAKNAKPRLAKSLIEMGMKREGTEIYAQMLRTQGGVYTAHQFLNAGEALIDARSWELANQAFDKAISLAATNQQTVVAKARMGQAKAAWKQGSLAEARASLDLFLQDPKMSKMPIAAEAYFMLIEIASEQGRTEKDASLRQKYFGAAIGALKKVRGYWAKKPVWERDSLDLLSGEVLIRRMKAEEAMGLKDEAIETCGRAAATFQVFLQSHGPTEALPLEKMEPGCVQNLEKCYSLIVPLFTKQGSQNAEQAELAVEFAQQYFNLFPNGKNAAEIRNCMNQSKADLGSKGTRKKAEKPSAAQPATVGEAEKSDVTEVTEEKKESENE